MAQRGGSTSRPLCLSEKSGSLAFEERESDGRKRRNRTAFAEDTATTPVHHRRVRPHDAGGRVLRGRPHPGRAGIPNDSLGSINVGSITQLVICKNDNYGGGCSTFTVDVNALTTGIGNDLLS